MVLYSISLPGTAISWLSLKKNVKATLWAQTGLRKRAGGKGATGLPRVPAVCQLTVQAPRTLRTVPETLDPACPRSLKAWLALGLHGNKGQREEQGDGAWWVGEGAVDTARVERLESGPAPGAEGMLEWARP